MISAGYKPKSGSPTQGLSFRFDRSETAEMVWMGEDQENIKFACSVLSPERKKRAAAVYPHPTGSELLEDYRECPASTPLRYSALIFQSPTIEPEESVSPRALTLRPRLPVSYCEGKPKTGSPTQGLSFRFDRSETAEMVWMGEDQENIKFACSVLSPERKKRAAAVYPHPTGSELLEDYRECPASTPLRYSALIFQSPTIYKKERVDCYVINKKDLEKSLPLRKPSNQSLFKKENASAYARGKKIGCKSETRFEYCHNVAYRFWANSAQTHENIFVQTEYFNSQQLVVENILTRLVLLLGEISVRQTCERFEGSNLGKRVKYELTLPGCEEPWEIEVKAENAHVQPHYVWQDSRLKIIAGRLMESSHSEVRVQGKILQDEIKAKHQKENLKKGKGSMPFLMGAGIGSMADDYQGRIQDSPLHSLPLSKSPLKRVKKIGAACPG